ncbi:ATP phosphoribosyltransferase [candidate division WOR-3 bacterium]|nr:ATP phosphoribosyltransferase [candidate division WOR-3 bacterium]
MNTIKLGLPKGSLNSRDRGNTYQLLIDSGYDIRGYDPGDESDRKLKILNDPEIEVYLVRPQSAPVELNKGFLDIAIVGDDWVTEESIANSKNNIFKIGDLEYGKTRIVAAIPNNLPFESFGDLFNKKRKKPILCFTEYINITKDFIVKNEAYISNYGAKNPLVQIRGLIEGENEKVQIISSDGVTEGYIAKGADIIVDNAQSGKTLKEYGLKEIEEIMHSSAGLYGGPTCDEWKKKKAEDIYQQLYGAVTARRYFDVKFNVNNNNIEKVRNYLITEKLCADEPTIIAGKKYSQVNILILKERFPLVLSSLKKDYNISAIVRNEIKQFVK